MAQGERSMHTELLKQEFARAEAIVKERLDGLILQFEETNQPFVMTYQKRAQSHRHWLDAEADATDAA